jgi:hypothetical protein
VRAASNGASVVSPEALGAFFAEEPIEMFRPRRVHLNNLGLNDSHCEVMAQVLARDDALMRPIGALTLTDNPSIGQQGYEALLGLLNRRFDIVAVVVDDQNWKSTFDMALQMNRSIDRGRFLENGVIPLKAMWVNCLTKLANTRHYSLSEVQKLNTIWHTLREDPDLLYASRESY